MSIETIINFELFKECYAKNESYIAAKLVHHMITNERGISIVALDASELKTRIRNEIKKIINQVPNEYGLNHIICNNSLAIKTKTKYKLVFASSDLWALRGLNMDMLYTVSDEVSDFYCILKPSEYPNLYVNRNLKE